uniref:Uncharacterized protein n=1 Tax=Meloidogyne enterolobii TaxID=390850 RepID=A0A6V7WTQ3_MELEN|nr:unnamed protein product [Meloidogyne enterolobii]
MDILLQNISNTNLMEYGLEMSEKLGKKRVVKMYYEYVLDIYLGIYLKFKTNEDFENELKNNSNNYCYIDKNILDFERTEEWAVNYYDEIGMQKDGFRLAYLEGIDINEKEITTKQKEEIFEEILNNSKLHKVTFTEAHKLIESKFKSKIFTETKQSELEHPMEIESLKNNENTNKQEKQLKNYSEIIGSELNKIKEIFEKQKEEKEMENIKRLTKDLRHINFEYFQQFEWNIKLKTECQKCLDFIVLSKTSLNPNFVLKALNEKEFENNCEYIKNPKMIW